MTTTQTRPAPVTPAPSAPQSGGWLTKLLSLASAMFRGFRRDRAALFFTLLFPLVFLIIFGGLFGNQGATPQKVLEIGSVPLIDQLPAADRAELDKVLEITKTDDRAGALDKVRNGDDAGAIEQSGNTVVLHFSAANATVSGALQGVLSSFVQSANVAATGQPPRFTLDTQQVEDKSLDYIQFITPGLLGWAIALGATFGAAATLVTWRQKKILRRLRLAPVGIPTIISARVVFTIGVALIQLVIFVAVATSLFHLKLTHYWWMSIPLVVCGTLSFMAIGLLAGARAKSSEAASAIANLITIPMAFLSGSFFPITLAPRWLQILAEVFPLRHLNDGMLDVMVRGKGPASVLPEMGILLGFTVVISAIAAVIFRWEEI
jgi:ABC-2 type transport system permease protein